MNAENKTLAAEDSELAEKLDKYSVVGMKLSILIGVIAAVLCGLEFQAVAITLAFISGLALIMSYILFVVACAMDCMMMD